MSKHLKINELIDAALDWAVATITKAGIVSFNGKYIIDTAGKHYSPSTDWSQGGPIIERESRIAPVYDERFNTWLSYGQSPVRYGKQTFLVAAMRCYVASKLGDDVEVPDELC